MDDEDEMTTTTTETSIILILAHLRRHLGWQKGKEWDWTSAVFAVSILN